MIRQAYTGLFQLASLSLFEKYVAFIDLYADVKPDEQRQLCQELIQHEETAMLEEYLKDMGRKKGHKEGSLYESLVKLLRYFHSLLWVEAWQLLNGDNGELDSFCSKER